MRDDSDVVVVVAVKCAIKVAVIVSTCISIRSTFGNVVYKIILPLDCKVLSQSASRNYSLLEVGLKLLTSRHVWIKTNLEI